MDKEEDKNYSTYKDGTMVDYMHNLDKLSFADVMQFADFGPKLKGLNQISKNNICEDHDIDQETAGIEMIDPVYFLKFPVLNDDNDNKGDPEEYDERDGDVEGGHGVLDRFLDHKNVPIGGAMDMMMNVNEGGKNKRKRARSVKTSEEVESQRMTHIAVERNRRKQMNEHLRVLRSLMPGSYVQRGDQASIIGGAIEFVRELEQLLECLESQKRRRLYGEGGPPVTRQIAGDTNTIQQFPPFETSAGGSFQEEETAENKSCFADVEVKLLGFDAVIKILCRRRPGQLVTTIAALQDLQLNILHTNITTIEQTVLYSFNVKVGNEMRFTAEDIANSVQQIFSFIHANTSM